LCMAHPQLRLLLTGKAEADPGYYQLVSAVRDLRRICGKQPQVVNLRRAFM
ncbi:unnamed protein product, partial [Effrenium voratum]